MTTLHQTRAARSHLVSDVSQALRELRALEPHRGGGNSLRVKIFRNYTAEIIEPFLKCYFAREDVKCDVSFGGYATTYQELLDADDLRTYELILLSLTLEGFERDTEALSEPGRLLSCVTDLADIALDKSNATVILNTFIRPIFDDGGAALALQANSQTSVIADVNRGLRAYAAAKAPRCLLVDWETLVMRLGADTAIDPRMGYLARAPFRPEFLSNYAYEIVRIGRALKGRNKKCLILDCDNTLWGGIVGEVGVTGIELDPINYPGKAYYDFQRAVLKLAERGVMLALCSKNNETDVMEVLDSHPHCLLKREHLVGHHINWNDKERNIEAIVEELNIGMDSVVFVDDSPVECERVKTFLPDITVRTVPAQLYELPLLIDREGLFDKLGVTDEDKRRTGFYRTEVARRAMSRKFANVDDFLASLELKVRIETPPESRISRVSQLTQKTNQFNLTTRRYSEADIVGMNRSPDCAVLAMTVGDRFGDLGLAGIFIARRLPGEEALIDTLLMSCRALGRKLELEFVARCVELLDQRWKPRRWHAEYIKTRKNEQVAEFWPSFGFAADARSDDRVRYVAERDKLSLPHFPYIAVDMA